MSKKLYFRHGTMDCGKTASLLMIAYNYEKLNKKILIFKPTKDTRSKKGYIESRNGFKHSCMDIDKNFNIYEYINNLPLNNEKIHCILIDESQFLTTIQVEQLAKITVNFNIPVICYGLKNSYIKGTLFEGSKALLYFADSIEELKNICSFCDKKATMNLCIKNNKPIYNGKTVQIGDTSNNEDIYYIPVCKEHYFYPKTYKGMI